MRWWAKGLVTRRVKKDWWRSARMNDVMCRDGRLMDDARYGQYERKPKREKVEERKRTCQGPSQSSRASDTAPDEEDAA